MAGIDRLRLRTRRLDWLCEPEDAFAALFGTSPEAFWLGGSRFSFMGDASGPLARTLYYDAGKRRLLLRSAGGLEQELEESIFDHLGAQLARLRLRRPPEPPELPFDLTAGFVGFIGYEVGFEAIEQPVQRSLFPDAALIFADRVVAFDASERSVWLLEVVANSSEPGEWPDETWLDETEARLATIELLPDLILLDQDCESPPFAADLDRDAYRDAIARCGRELEAGESYEICLTTQLRVSLQDALGAETVLDPVELYRTLRRVNPAPHSAYLRFGELAVLSSSPERFLRLDRERRLESKPIKGTAPRSADPVEDARLAAQLAADPKNRAENMMIADLMRNDLGRVCETGSIEVPALAKVESFAGAHQLVTTVTGKLRADRTAVDAVRAAFPPGSMTGAPKIRTMEIIDELEPSPRGVYSGCLGYFSLDGCADLSVVIRTIVVRGNELSIGTGGAITVLSDPEEELAELELKAEPLVRATALYASSRRRSDTRRVPTR